MFFKSAFEKRLDDLAGRAGLKITEASSAGAKLNFRVGDHRQPLYIIPYAGVWELSCPSVLVADHGLEFPHSLLAILLEVNAKNKRGFWCIETIAGKKVLSYMHNIPENLLSPDEFRSICESVVEQVEKVEEVCRQLA